MNENIFSGKAEVYMQCRPRYAQGVLDFIRRETALTPDSLIADIGAGAGIFTEQLMSLGCRVAAVEPNGDMRSRIAETAPGAEIISAPAEHTGLPDGSVSLITAAESFHWFQPDDFREECRRILRPDGKVMIVWNLTDKKTSTVQRLHELNMKYCEKYRSLFTNNEQFSVSDEKYKVMSENYLTNSRRESTRMTSCLRKNSLSAIAYQEAMLPNPETLNLTITAQRLKNSSNSISKTA